MIDKIFAIVSLIREIIAGVKAISKFVEESKNEKWWSEWTEARQLLSKAQTSEERREAARRIRESLAGL